MVSTIRSVKNTTENLDKTTCGKATLMKSKQTCIDVRGSRALKPSCGEVQHTTSCQQLTIGTTIP
jgi:hypothetical protein